MGEPSDEQLMERFCQGDNAAFEVLFDRHGRRVHGHLRTMVRDAALAEDLTQTTFLSIVRTRDRYPKGAPVVPWIFAIATNAARDVLRRKGLKIEELSATGEVPIHVPAPTGSPESDPGLRRAIDEAMAKLPPQYREAVVLHKVEGLSFQEIAEALGITNTAARLRAHRGYEKLRELLAPLGVE